MSAPTPSPTAQVYQVNAPAMAAASWHREDIVVAGSSVQLPTRTWSWNASTTPTTEWATNYPDGTGWVKGDQHYADEVGGVIVSSYPEPELPLGMTFGQFAQQPALGCPATDGNAYDILVALSGEWIGFPLDLAVIAGATAITDVYIQVSYAGSLPGVMWGPNEFTDVVESSLMTPAAQAAWVAGDTIQLQLIDDSGSVATWRMREVPPFDPSNPIATYYQSWPNVFYGNTPVPFKGIFLTPYASVPFGSPPASPCSAINSVKVWREALFSSSISLHVTPNAGVAPLSVAIGGTFNTTETSGTTSINWGDGTTPDVFTGVFGGTDFAAFAAGHNAHVYKTAGTYTITVTMPGGLNQTLNVTVSAAYPLAMIARETSATYSID